MTGSISEEVDHLSRLSPSDLCSVIGRVLTGQSTSAWTPQMLVLLRQVLLEQENLERQAGPATQVYDSFLDAYDDDIRIKLGARAAILGLPMLAAGAVAELMGSGARNPREVASALRRNGTVVAVPHGNRYLYPAFQFDPVEQRVWPTVASINQLLDATADPWGVASWWISAHPRLGNRAPRDLLDTKEEFDLVVVARGSRTRPMP